MTVPTFVPALEPPAGVTPSHLGHNSLWKWHVLCQTACLSIPGVLFFLRVYIRIWIKKKWILEDYMCCLAFAGLVTYSGLSTAVINKHGGMHEWDLTKPEAESVLYYHNFTLIEYGPAVTFIKSTILLLYLRIFSPRRGDRLYIAIRILMAVIICFYTSITVAKIVVCLPRSRIWDKSVPGKCLNLRSILESSGFFNLLSDLCILLIPLKGVWNLQVSRTRKIGIYVIFTIGSIAPVFSVIGFIVRIRVTSNRDETHYLPIVMLWATAELATGMIIICLPIVPTLFKCCRKKPSVAIGRGAKSHELNCYPSYGVKGLETNPGRVEGRYTELREGLQNRHDSMVIQNPFFTEISGGDASGPADYASGPQDGNAGLGGILKTVTIEQSNTPAAHVVA